MSAQSISGLQELLPEDVISQIREQYASGIKIAERLFEKNSADEDAVTGALGQELTRIGKIPVNVGELLYEVEFDYQKLRGRGAKAPENFTGADGIFQISVFTCKGEVLFSKGLPFQSKINWIHRDGNLVTQAKKMQTILRGGIVIDYSSEGYKTCTASQVIEADGSRSTIEQNHLMHTLERSICNDFLNCHLGERNLYFNRQLQRFSLLQRDARQELHIIDTQVVIANDLL
ncbi:hypothetical protein [Methylobacillus sp.]|uniref:hypothetical protein n=1 Tax=Methylobacillus sp. TaxID=56818 RepID=UPI002FDFECB0